MSVALKRFIAGFLATLTFHQAAIAALWAAKAIPRAPFNMSPVPPFGVPSVISLAFWGGVWGIAILWAAARMPARWRLPATIVLGAIGPVLVAFYVVGPMKGRGGPFPLSVWIAALVINGLWAVGTILFVRLMSRGAPRRALTG